MVTIKESVKSIIIYFIFCFFLSEFIDTVSGVSSVLSHVTNKSSIILFTQVQFFKYLSISQCLSHSQAHVLGFQA